MFRKALRIRRRKGGELGADGGRREPSSGKGGSNQNSTGGVAQGRSGGDSAGGLGGDGAGGGLDGSGGNGGVDQPSLSIERPSPVRVRQGSSISFPVRVVRGGGFEGAVTLKFAGLPKGLSSTSGILNANEDEAKLSLVASQNDSVTGGPTPIRLTAASLDGAVTGEVEFDLVVAGKAGTIDKTFGSNGVLRGVPPSPVATAIDNKGGIYVGGRLGNGWTEGVGWVGKTTSNGAWLGAPAFDFGEGGALESTLLAFAIDDDGLWISEKTIVGEVETYRVRRFGPDGKPMTSFGSSGIVEFPVELKDSGSFDGPRLGTLVPRGDGGAYLVVEGQPPVVALGASGEVDDAFDFFSDSCVESIRADSNRGLLVQWCDATAAGDVEVSRVTSSGALDETFGKGGSMLVAPPGGPGSTPGVFRGLTHAIPIQEGLLLTAWADLRRGTEPGAFILGLDDEGAPLSQFAVGGAIFLPGDGGCIHDPAPHGAGFVALNSGNSFTCTAPSKLLKFDLNGKPDLEFGEAGVFDPVARASDLAFSASEEPHAQSIVIDERLGRAVLTLTVLKDGEPTTGALIRVWL